MPLPRIAIIRNIESQKISLPRYGNPVGTSMTLLSAHADSIKIAPGHYEVIDTGLAIALPIGLEAQVRSLKESTRTGVFVLNAPLTIDASDRQDIKVCLYNASSESVIVKYNDPIALLVFSPVLRVEWDDMTTKHQTQAAQTEALLQRTQQEIDSLNASENTDEFEPLEQTQANEPVNETQADVIQEETTEVVEPSATQDDAEPSQEQEGDVVLQRKEELNDLPSQSENMAPVEPPAIVKEFEEMANRPVDVQENGEKNEN